MVLLFYLSGQERLEKSKEAIRRLTEEKKHLEEESRLKLENSERNLEQVRASELQELRRGKVEALQVLQVCELQFIWYEITIVQHNKHLSKLNSVNNNATLRT